MKRTNFVAGHLLLQLSFSFFKMMLQPTDFKGFEGLLRENEISIPPAWREIKLYNRGKIERIHELR